MSVLAEKVVKLPDRVNFFLCILRGERKAPLQSDKLTPSLFVNLGQVDTADVYHAGECRVLEVPHHGDELKPMEPLPADVDSVHLPKS